MKPSTVGWLLLWVTVLMAVSGFCGTRAPQEMQPAPIVSSR